MPKPTYSEKLRDPRWQRKRLEVMQRSDFKCENCRSDSVTLHIHHTFYERGKEPWEYDAGTLRCYCSDCHEQWHEAKAAAQGAFSVFCSRLSPDQIAEFSSRLSDFGPLGERDFPVILAASQAQANSCDAERWREQQKGLE